MWMTRYYWNLSKLCNIRPELQTMMQEALDKHGHKLKAMGLPPKIAAATALYFCVDNLDSTAFVFSFLKEERNNEFAVYKEALIAKYMEDEA